MNYHFDIIKGLTGKLYIEFHVTKEFSPQVFSHVVEPLFDDTPDTVMTEEFISKELDKYIVYVFEQIPLTEGERREVIEWLESIREVFRPYYGMTYKEFTEKLKDENE